jgi:hypothetical protein
VIHNQLQALHVQAIKPTKPAERVPKATSLPLNSSLERGMMNFVVLFTLLLCLCYAKNLLIKLLLFSIPDPPLSSLPIYQANFIIKKSIKS